MDEKKNETPCVKVPKEYLSGFSVLNKDVRNPIVRDDGGGRGSLAVRWGPSNRLALFANTTNDMSKTGTVRAITEVIHDYPKPIRRLMNESHDIFYKLHERYQKPSINQQELYRVVLKASKEYHVALKRCIQDMESAPRLEQEQIDLIDMLKATLALWHLVEILILQERTNIDRQFVAWIHEHYAVAENEMKTTRLEDVLTNPQPETAPGYWATIYFMVTTGRGHDAARLLMGHTKRISVEYKDVFSTLIQLLHSMPMPSADSQTDTDHFRDWRVWRSECEHVLANNAFVRSDSNFSTLLKIMCADEASLLQHTSTWYELMAAQVLLHEPNIRNRRFEAHMEQCMKAHQVDPSFFDSIVMTIMECDVPKLIMGLDGLGFSWTTAHLTDLLVCSGHLSFEIVDLVQCSLREYFLIHYVEDMSSLSGTWVLFAEYLNTCKIFGPGMLETLLEREAPDSDYKAEKLVQVCQENALESVAVSIQRTRATHWKALNFPGTAIYWLLQSNDEDRISSFCTNLLETYIEQNDTDGLHAVVEALGEDREILSSKMTHFLRQYRDLLLLLDDCEYFETANEMVSLRRVQRLAASGFVKILSSDDVPVKFLLELIMKLIPFLEVSPALFSSRQSYCLMECIQRIELSYRRDEYLKALSKDTLQQVRAGLATNLTNAIIRESVKASTSTTPSPLLAQSPFLK